MNWINLAQDTKQWWAHVNRVVNSQVPQNAGNFLLAEQVLASQGLYSMELLKC
jgi:hypothetical protein